MQKITFEDTQVTKKPYVTINETEYEVQDGTYTGGTDLNATTFNNMQDNIESAINENVNNIGNLTDLNTTEKSTLVGAINEVKAGLGKITKLNTTDITTKAVHTLNYNVNNFDFILVFATDNQYGHFQQCSILKLLFNSAFYQKIQYSETGYLAFKLYDTTLDTTNSTGLGENYIKITALYGVKL
jgi:hypothetical protein